MGREAGKLPPPSTHPGLWLSGFRAGFSASRFGCSQGFCRPLSALLRPTGSPCLEFVLVASSMTALHLNGRLEETQCRRKIFAIEVWGLAVATRNRRLGWALAPASWDGCPCAVDGCLRHGQSPSTGRRVKLRSHQRSASAVASGFAASFRDGLSAAACPGCSMCKAPYST